MVFAHHIMGFWLGCPLFFVCVALTPKAQCIYGARRRPLEEKKKSKFESSVNGFGVSAGKNPLSIILSLCVLAPFISLSSGSLARLFPSSFISALGLSNLDFLSWTRFFLVFVLLSGWHRRT